MPWAKLHGKVINGDVKYISTGNDIDKVKYSEKEFKKVVEEVMNGNPPRFRILFPCAKNWPTWDAAIVLSAREEEKTAIHVIFLQTTTDPQHPIVSKGLNAIKDAAVGHQTYYHYVLVLLTNDHDPTDQKIPKWRDVTSSLKGEKDKFWTQKELKQYVMFVPMKQLFKPRSEDSTQPTTRL
jgi:hypothetical protein